MRQHAFNFDRETTRLLERANELTEDASDIWTESLNLLLEHFQKLTEVYLKRDFGEMMAFLVVPPPWDGTTFSVLLAKHARSFVEHGADRWIEPNTKRLEELVKEQGNRYACWADALKLTSVSAVLKTDDSIGYVVSPLRRKHPSRKGGFRKRRKCDRRRDSRRGTKREGWKGSDCETVRQDSKRNN